MPAHWRAHGRHKEWPESRSLFRKWEYDYYTCRLCVCIPHALLIIIIIFSEYCQQMAGVARIECNCTCTWICCMQHGWCSCTQERHLDAHAHMASTMLRHKKNRRGHHLFKNSKLELAKNHSSNQNEGRKVCKLARASCLIDGKVKRNGIGCACVQNLYPESAYY